MAVRRASSSHKNAMQEKGAGKRQAGRNKIYLGEYRRDSLPIYTDREASLPS